MRIIVYTPHSQDVSDHLGDPEYSYAFVMQRFRPVLEGFGDVVEVSDPDRQIPSMCDTCKIRGEPCVFLSFTPPHKIPLQNCCPTIPVFAWEFPDIPDETWHNDERNDWRQVLSRTQGAITHSNFAGDAVRKSMGNDYPITVCPAPLWDDYKDMRSPIPGSQRYLELSDRCLVVDTGNAVADSPAKAEGFASGTVIEFGASETDPVEHMERIALEGVVFTSVLNPRDSRKYWRELITAFCSAFRGEPRATLVVKFAQRASAAYIGGLITLLRRASPFRCRVIVIASYLDDDQYRALIEVSDYCVNASSGEGQCLPLMEFMSAGRPAIAPAHSAIRDYLTTQCGFEIASYAVAANWQHDPRQRLSTRQHRLNDESMEQALLDAYQCAVLDSSRFEWMSTNARDALQKHCSMQTAERALTPLLSGNPGRINP